jgi:quercetin dioxygenase-like cupin family protein
MAKSKAAKVTPIRSVANALVTGTHGEYTFGKTTYLPNGSCGPRVQENYQLIVLLKGSLRLTADRVVHELNPGDAILERFGQREFFRFSPTENSVHTWCEVKPHRLSRTEKRLLNAASGVFQAPSAVHVLIEEGLAVREEGEMTEAMAALAKACLLRFAQHVQAARPGPARGRFRDATALALPQARQRKPEPHDLAAEGRACDPAAALDRPDAGRGRGALRLRESLPSFARGEEAHRLFAARHAAA